MTKTTKHEVSWFEAELLPWAECETEGCTWVKCPSQSPTAAECKTHVRETGHEVIRTRQIVYRYYTNDKGSTNE